MLLAGMGIACVTAAIEYAWTKKARHREHRVGSSEEDNLNVGLCENVLVDNISIATIHTFTSSSMELLIPKVAI